MFLAYYQTISFTYLESHVFKLFRGSDSVPLPDSNLALLGYKYLLEGFKAQPRRINL